MRIPALLTLAALAALALSPVRAGAQAAPPPAAAQAPAGQTSPPLKNVQVLKDLTREQLIQTMRTYAASLGVECNFCHVQGDFASDAKREKVTARRMILMAQQIDADNFSGRPEVTCYTCHRGQTHPVSRVPTPEPPPGGPVGSR